MSSGWEATPARLATLRKGTDKAIADGRERRSEVLGFIERYMAEHGWAPTVREIAEGLGTSSTSIVHAQLRRLHDDGLIVMGGGPRMIRVIGPR